MFESILAAMFRIGSDYLLLLGAVVVIVFLATSSRKQGQRCGRCQEMNRNAAVYCAQCGVRLSESHKKA